MVTLSQTELEQMRSAVERVGLSMTCTVERATQTGTDAHGHPIESWSTHLANVPCFYWEDTQRKVVDQINAVFTEAHIKFAARTDVQARDRVRDVSASDGAIVAGVLQVKAVLQRESMTQAEVEAVT